MGKVSATVVATDLSRSIVRQLRGLLVVKPPAGNLSKHTLILGSLTHSTIWRPATDTGLRGV